MTIFNCYYLVQVRVYFLVQVWGPKNCQLGPDSNRQMFACNLFSFSKKGAETPSFIVFLTNSVKKTSHLMSALPSPAPKRPNNIPGGYEISGSAEHLKSELW